jgi:hypothetical protein
MAYPIFRQYDLPQYDTENILAVKTGTDTLAGGYCVVATAVAGTYLDGLGAVYTPTQVAAITDKSLAIVDVGSMYYHDSNGNRINTDDPTAIATFTGDRVKAVRPILNKHYYMTTDLVTSGTQAAIAAGAYLIPTASSYLWTATADITTGTPSLALLIEEINVKDTFVGLSASTGMRVRVVRVAQA